jgi:hypothetical protein
MIKGIKEMKMTNYDVMPLKENGDYMWAVFEFATEQVIETFFFEEDAVRMAKQLESGAGFSGWTPSFLLTKVVIKENINQKFSELVLSE